MRRLILLFVTPLILWGVALAEERGVIFKENFQTLNNWTPLSFEKVPKKSSYEIISASDEGTMLKLSSEGGASALISKETFSVHEARFISWSWRVDKFPALADPKTKGGDDYPARVYLIFQYDSEGASFLKRLRYKTFKTLYGEYPPDSSLNYVWSGVETKERSFVSPYTDQARIVVLQSERHSSRVWKQENRDAFSDYVKEFGVEPPELFRLGIMTDSDNTEDSTLAFLKHLTVSALLQEKKIEK